MTKEEALNILECWLERDKMLLGQMDTTEAMEVYQVAIDAINKRTPVKVIEKVEGNWLNYYCPHCNDKLMGAMEWPNCMWCGQALDWSEND